MALKLLTLEGMRELDGGRVATAFDQELKRGVADCVDRPGEDRPRRIVLYAELTPVCGENGVCEGARMKFQIKGSIPTRRSKIYSFGVKPGNGLVFSTDSQFKECFHVG